MKMIFEIRFDIPSAKNNVTNQIYLANDSQWLLIRSVTDEGIIVEPFNKSFVPEIGKCTLITSRGSRIESTIVIN